MTRYADARLATVTWLEELNPSAAAEQRFRRVRGYKSMGVLLANVGAFDGKLVSKSEPA